MEFTNLVFIPSMAPFDLYDPERRSLTNLYVNRVFITDNCDGLIPKWLRFLRGVIDTPDVDLNVSREMLQQNPVVTKISKAVVKRVLGEFGKALEKQREDYENPAALGRVIKEGLYEDDAQPVEDPRHQPVPLDPLRRHGHAEGICRRVRRGAGDDLLPVGGECRTCGDEPASGNPSGRRASTCCC